MDDTAEDLWRRRQTTAAADDDDGCGWRLRLLLVMFWLVNTNKFILINLAADKSPDLQATFPRGIGRLLVSFTTIAWWKSRTTRPSRPSSVCSFMDDFFMNSMEPSVTGPMYVVWEDGGRMGRLSSRHEYVPKKKYLFCSRPNQDSHKNDVNLSKTWKVAFLRWG